MIIGSERGRWMMMEKPKVLAKQGIEVGDEAAGEILEMVRSSSVAPRRSMMEKEIIQSNQDWKDQKGRLE
jgi:hypothetical protein